MGHEQNRASGPLQPTELVKALLLERGVADRQHLVDQQDLGIDLDRGREREPHEHSRGVVLQSQIGEFTELRERDDVVEAGTGFPAREPEHDRVDDHVVAGSEVHVEADAEFDERRQPPVDCDLAAIDFVDPGQALEQRALAAPVAPDDSEELALGDVDGHVLDRPQLVVVVGAERV